MKNKNLIIGASAVVIIGILAIVLLRKRKIEQEQEPEMTPEQTEAVKSLATTISSGGLKFR